MIIRTFVCNIQCRTVIFSIFLWIAFPIYSLEHRQSFSTCFKNYFNSLFYPLGPWWFCRINKNKRKVLIKTFYLIFFVLECYYSFTKFFFSKFLSIIKDFFLAHYPILHFLFYFILQNIKIICKHFVLYSTISYWKKKLSQKNETA